MYVPYAHTTINMKRLTDTAILPKRADAGSVGYDLYADSECLIHSGQRALVKTGIAMAIPDGLAGMIWDKSGHANNSGITILGGLIDPSYRGEIKVILLNTGDSPFSVLKGMKITQIVLVQTATPVVIEVDSLDDTSRGVGGFGSTGSF